MSRILLAVSRYDYGRPDWGDSFEFTNFVGPLERLGHQVRVFDTMPSGAEPTETGRALLTSVREFEPDLLLCLLSTNEVPLDAIREAGQLTTTANWFADDSWRFSWFSKKVAPAFDWTLTTSRRAERKYLKLGVSTVFLPWACNTAVFHPSKGSKQFDVSFVGQRHGNRGRMVERLQADGLDVYARGAGWPGGRVGWLEMAEIFSTTRVNLSLSESSAGPLVRRGWRFRGAYRMDRALLPFFPPPAQMKARIFEITGCGGFCITGPFDELAECFDPGSEVVVASTYREVRDGIRHFLAHEDERAGIARAALEKCRSEHTYERRFAQLFNRIYLGKRG